jgi:hypothetical protein
MELHNTDTKFDENQSVSSRVEREKRLAYFQRIYYVCFKIIVVFIFVVVDISNGE